jgi:hypothetical protein
MFPSRSGFFDNERATSPGRGPRRGRGRPSKTSDTGLATLSVKSQFDLVADPLQLEVITRDDDKGVPGG